MSGLLLNATAAGLPDTGLIPITPVDADLGVSGDFVLQRIGHQCFLLGTKVVVPAGISLPRIFDTSTPGFGMSPNPGFAWPAQVSRTGAHLGVAHLWGVHVILNTGSTGYSAATFAMMWVTRDDFPVAPFL